MRRAFRTRGQRIRGVNLGNWLVLERWMESKRLPGPFHGTKADDEHGLRRELDAEGLAGRLELHRNSYVTDDTFAWLADLGCNLVRIPVPYHLFGDDAHETCAEHLDRAMDLAQDHDLPVLIDLHTVPGGQNGFDNSGVSGLCTWHLDPTRVQHTLSMLEDLARRYAGHPALFGIEVMNEPASRSIFASSMRRYGAAHASRVERSAPIPHAVLAQFYHLAYERLRPIVGPDVALVFHDQFELGAWDRFLPASRYPNVWMDTHQYVAPAARALHARSLRTHLAIVRAMGVRIALAQRHHPVLVGEWSLSHNIPSLSTLPSEERDRAMATYARAQLAAFDRGMGSCFWSLRNGSRDVWSLEASIRHGWFDLRL